MWPVWHCSIVPLYLINDTTFGKKIIECKMSFVIFWTTFAWNISHSKKNSARYCQKCILVFAWSTRYSCRILIKLEFSRQIVEKHSDIKFHEYPFIGSRVVPCGRTDRHDKTNSLFFRKFGKAPKNCCIILVLVVMRLVLRISVN